MAIGDPYLDAADLKSYLGITGTGNDTLITNAIAAASDWVNDYCARDFNLESSATARIYEPSTPWRLDVDDFYTTTGLIVALDSGDTGTYGLTVAATDYVVKPYNGVENGIAGYPYRQIIAAESQSFLCRTRRPRVQVTAKWGWAAVPDKVKQATRILASELFRLKDAPLGIAGVNDFGPMSVREVPQVSSLLKQLQHPSRTGPLVA
jgi:hypothetical protein